MRGYGFEYISKIVLRRQHKNNFIFQLCQYDNVEEILTKYKLNIKTEIIEKQINLLRKIWNKTDLIEFKLTNKNERIIEKIILYDVKTKYFSAKKDKFEVCKSNADFMKKALELQIESYIASIIMFEN